MLKRICIAALLLIHSGCGGGSGGGNGGNNGGSGGIDNVPSVPQTPEQHILALEESGEIPKLERTNTLAGIDSNIDGIRDDIEEYIFKTYPRVEEQVAVMQTARAFQSSITIDSTDIEAINSSDEKITRAINCVYEIFNESTASKPAAQVVREMESLTTNTKQRLLAYLQYNNALDGSATMIPEGNTCE